MKHDKKKYLFLRLEKLVPQLTYFFTFYFIKKSKIKLEVEMLIDSWINLLEFKMLNHLFEVIWLKTWRRRKQNFSISHNQILSAFSSVCDSEGEAQLALLFIFPFELDDKCWTSWQAYSDVRSNNKPFVMKIAQGSYLPS